MTGGEEADVRRAAGRWATSPGRLHSGAAARNVEGRLVTGPQQGFGRLWQRSYTLAVGDVCTPEHAVAEWVAHFGSFWPRGNRFLGAEGSLSPGDVAPIRIGAAPGVELATGVLVLYADDRTFTFMTPQGHMFGGWITFGAHGDPEHPAGTVLEISILIRAGDPLWELAMPLMMRKEDEAWGTTLQNLARHLGAPPAAVVEQSVLLDRSRLWRNWTNVWHNAGVRSVGWTVASHARRTARGARTLVARGG